uniref:Uncharacterized protein n=1 Tax=Vespula pensylvanica TaxID=30213 RepID=A0A834NQL1_VESPE|nr:hypothetical protein H0235_012249 [Vespula pensylvanica]
MELDLTPRPVSGVSPYSGTPAGEGRREKRFAAAATAAATAGAGAAATGPRNIAATVATAAAAVAEVAAAVAVAAAAATAAAAAAAATVNEMMIVPERRGEREMETKRKDELIAGLKKVADSKRGREGEVEGEREGGGGGGAGDCGETNKLHRGHLIFAVSTGDELSRCDDNLNYRSDEVVKKIASTRRNVRNLFCGKAS